MGVVTLSTANVSAHAPMGTVIINVASSQRRRSRLRCSEVRLPLPRRRARRARHIRAVAVRRTRRHLGEAVEKYAQPRASYAVEDGSLGENVTDSFMKASALCNALCCLF